MGWDGWDGPDAEYAYSGRTYTYKVEKPFEGIERKKWPNTFMQLVLFYYGGEWYSMTKHVMEKKPQSSKSGPEKLGKWEQWTRWKAHLKKEPKSEDYEDVNDWLDAYELWDSYDYETGTMPDLGGES